MTHKKRKSIIFSSAISNVRSASVTGIACLLSVIFFFCSKNQTPVSSTPPAVKILSFAPLSARISDQIVITGENFSADKTADSVFFTHGRIALIDSATVTKLYIRVPQGTVTGTIVVRTGSSADTSKQTFTLDTLPLPTIINLQPGSGPLGTIITITGTNFDTTSGHTIIMMGGVREKIISISPTKIVVEMVGGTAGPITITMNSDSLTTTTGFIVTKRNETVTSFAPARGKVGTQVTITGTNFNPDSTGLVVTFGNAPAQVMSVTATQIVTVVPSGAATAPISVSFFGEQTSSAAAFQVEGKYQFDSADVVIGNIPVIMRKYVSEIGDQTDTLSKYINFTACSPACVFNDSLSNGDTVVFTTFVRLDPYGNGCHGKIIVVFDSLNNSIRSFISQINSYQFEQVDVCCYNTTTTSSNIEFSDLSLSQDSVFISGLNVQPHFANGYYSYGSYTDGMDHYVQTDSVLQFLPFTDSTYIKIVLK